MYSEVIVKRILLSLCIVLLGAVSSVYAAVTDAACHSSNVTTPAQGGCFVATTGNDDTGNGTIGSPWLTLSKCFSEAHAGDTCWFRGGTYYSPTNSCSGNPGCAGSAYGYYFGIKQRAEYHVVADRVGLGGSAGNPVTLRGYPGETVVWTTPGTRSSQGDTGCELHIMTTEGTVGRVTFLDLTFKQGTMKFSEGASYITFERTVFHANTTRTSVPAMLISGANTVTTCDNWIIRNNLFISDNTDTQNYCLLNNGQGEGFTDFYSQDSGLFEHNDFIITSNAGNINLQYLLGFKDWNVNNTIQYNYIADLSGDGTERAIWIGGNGNNPGVAGNNHARYNISNAAGPAWHSSESAFNNFIYNNTFYNQPDGCWSTLGDGAGEMQTLNSFFNNICVVDSEVAASNGTGLYMDICEGSPVNSGCTIQEQAYVNDNIYWKVGSGIRQWKNNSRWSLTHYESDSNGITNWSFYLADLSGSFSGREANSRVINPGLTNPAAGDFSLIGGAAARTGGTGGAYPTWIGADDPTSSSDYIGCTFDPRCHSYAGSQTCGNDIREGTEVCDGTDLNSQTCASQGFASGTLSCTTCTAFNTSQCSSVASPSVKGLILSGATVR